MQMFETLPKINTFFVHFRNGDRLKYVTSKTLNFTKYYEPKYFTLNLQRKLKKGGGSFLGLRVIEL